MRWGGRIGVGALALSAVAASGCAAPTPATCTIVAPSPSAATPPAPTPPPAATAAGAGAAVPAASMGPDALLDLWFGCALDGAWSAAVAAAPGVPARTTPDRCGVVGRALGVTPQLASALAPEAVTAMDHALDAGFDAAGTSPDARGSILQYYKLGTQAVRETRQAIDAAREAVDTVQLGKDVDPGLSVELRDDRALRGLYETVRADVGGVGPLPGENEARALAWLLGAYRLALARDLPPSLKIDTSAPTIAVLLDIEPNVPSLSQPDDQRWYAFVTLAATHALPAGFMRAPQFASPAIQSDTAHKAYDGLLVTVAAHLRDAASVLPSESELGDAVVGEAEILEGMVHRD